MNLYPLGRWLFKVFFSLFYRVRVSGLDRVPPTGGVIMCANHIHALDPPLVGAVLSRPVSFMAKEELFQYPVLGSLLLRVGAFPVRRGKADRGALRKAIAVIKDDGVLGLFPEGTRSTSGELQEAKGGAGFIALRTSAPILPVAVVGPYRVFGPVRVIVGEPFHLQDARPGEDRIDAAGQQIMEGIRSLLENR